MVFYPGSNYLGCMKGLIMGVQEAVWIIGAVIGTVGILYYCLSFIRRAFQKYGLRLITSVSFGAVLCSVIFAGCIYLQGTYQPGGAVPWNGFVFGFASMVCAGFALYRNIYQSSISFGVFFTLLQLMIVLSLGLVLVWYLLRKFPRRVGFLRRA